MGQNLNIQMKEFNGTDYDLLYPVTLPENIQGDGVFTKPQTLGQTNQTAYGESTPDGVFTKLSSALIQNSSGGNITNIAGTEILIPGTNTPFSQLANAVFVQPDGSYESGSTTTLDIGNCKFYYGQYQGTGSNTNVLVSPFPIKILYIYDPGSPNNVGSVVYHSVIYFGQPMDGNSNIVEIHYNLSSDGKTLTIQGEDYNMGSINVSGAEYILNLSGVSYYYYILG